MDLLKVQNKQILYLDVLRAFAIIGVVLIHVSSLLLNNLSQNTFYDWWTANLLDSFFRPCIPLFIMISGLLLLNKSKVETLYIFFKKRFMKVGIPFLVWSVIYLFRKNYYLNEPVTIESGIYDILTNNVVYHFWFFYVIISLYLTVPILRYFTQRAEYYQMVYFLCIAFIAASLLPLIQYFYNFKFALDLSFFSGYLFYFVMGHFLEDTKLNKKALIVATFIFLIFWVFTALVTYFLTVGNHNELQTVFYRFLQPNIIVMSCAFFLIVKSLPFEKMPQQHPMLYRIITIISAYSLGIYIVHPIFLEILRRGTLGFTLSSESFNPILSIPLTTILTLLFSFLLVFILRNIPLVRYIVP